MPSESQSESFSTGGLTSLGKGSEESPLSVVSGIAMPRHDNGATHRLSSTSSPDPLTASGRPTVGLSGAPSREVTPKSQLSQSSKSHPSERSQASEKSQAWSLSDTDLRDLLDQNNTVAEFNALEVQSSLTSVPESCELVRSNAPNSVTHSAGTSQHVTSSGSSPSRSLAGRSQPVTSANSVAQSPAASHATSSSSSAHAALVYQGQPGVGASFVAESPPSQSLSTAAGSSPPQGSVAKSSPPMSTASWRSRGISLPSSSVPQSTSGAATQGSSVSIVGLSSASGLEPFSPITREEEELLEQSFGSSSANVVLS